MLPHNIRIEHCRPFGICLEPWGGNTELSSLDTSVLRKFVLDHRVIVLRGFSPMSREEFEGYAAGWGDLLLWKFGAILDVVVDPQAVNYLFTNGSVPHHWDGAFAETVPFLQIFQCLAAPAEAGGETGAGGETVFCDTTRLWAGATEEQQARWAATTISYSTDKLAHYGGRITANLVARHPITGETTLRFAEPPDAQTAPLNPLSLEVEGDTLANLMKELQPLLYAADNCYVHDWQEGDYVIADNHALLHARHAFAANASRHLQRIHII